MDDAPMTAPDDDAGLRSTIGIFFALVVGPRRAPRSCSTARWDRRSSPA
jgi:hypothetical protein